MRGLKRLAVAIVAVALLVVVPGVALADGIYGTCYAKSGERCAQGNHRISTSWNSNKSYPASNGSYSLDLGGTVDKRITVYCDGTAVGTVYVKGNTRFDVHCR